LRRAGQAERPAPPERVTVKR